MRLHLIRHGETDWNRQRKIQGAKDIPLNQTGKKQAEVLAQALSSREIGMVFSSRQRRAMETAEIIARFCKTPIALLDGLEEMRFGEWEGLSWEEIKYQYGISYEDFQSASLEQAPPEGESRAEVINRCNQALKKIVSDFSFPGDAAVVSHGAVISGIVGSVSEKNRNLRIPNTSVITLEYHKILGGFCLEKVDKVLSLKKI